MCVLYPYVMGIILWYMWSQDAILALMWELDFEKHYGTYKKINDFQISISV